MLIMATDYQPRNLVVPLVKIHINRCIEENYRSIIGVSRLVYCTYKGVAPYGHTRPGGGGTWGIPPGQKF